MPRYYDIDKLAEMLQAKADTLIEGKEAFLYVAKWLDLLPSADVVPKSEVEQAKADVAREIFELIECAFSPVFVYNGYTIKEYLAELKKKYAEEKS